MAATDPNIQYFESIRDRCKTELSQLASWPGYFNRRHAEFLTYYELMPQKHWGKVLEIAQATASMLLSWQGFPIR